MKSISPCNIILALFMFCAHQAMAHVELDYPEGGETFVQGEVVTVVWHVAVPHQTLNWDLFYSTDGGLTWDTIQMDIPTSQLTFDWVVPPINTDQARVRVFMDNVDENYVDISGDFSMIPNTSPPSLDAPASDLTIDCGSPTMQQQITAWLENNGGAEATNFCEELIWTNDYNDLSNDCGLTGSALVTFEGEDDCGIVITSAILSVVDLTPPNINAQANNMVVESDGQGNLNALNIWLSTRGGAQATDLCSGVTWTNSFTSLSDGCGLTGSATVMFTATDACGNSSQTAASFTIIDNTAPVIQQSAQDTIVACGVNQDAVMQNWLGRSAGAIASDLGGVSWSNTFSSLSDGCGLTGNATVLFYATDACGNSSQTQASFTVVDNAAPLIYQSAQDTTIACGLADQDVVIQNWLQRHAGAQATDGCGSVSWTHSIPAVPDSCGNAGSFVATFMITDECQNTSQVSATLNLLGASGINENADDTRFLIYPNPVSETLTIEFENAENYNSTIRLINVFGETIWSGVTDASKSFVQTDQFVPGIYFISVETAKGLYSKKIIIE